MRERIILRCLRMEPARRFQNVLDVKVELEELKEESDSQASAPAGAATVKRRSRRWWMAWAAAGFLVLAAAAMLLFSSSPNADRAEAVAVLPEMRGDGLLRDVDGVAVVDHVDLSGNRDRHLLGLA